MKTIIEIKKVNLSTDFRDAKIDVQFTMDRGKLEKFKEELNTFHLKLEGQKQLI